MSESKAEQEALTVQYTFGEFLQETPLLVLKGFTVALKRVEYGTDWRIPAIELHCPSAVCNGTRFFDPTTQTQRVRLESGKQYVDDHFIDYICRNCHRTRKTYAVRLVLSDGGKSAQAMKIGEYPAFGEPRPNAVKDVLDDEILYFERGYRAEAAGLGIGAFAYYRRFVESHKDKIIDEVRKVALAQGAKQDVLDTLDRARAMKSFEAAVREVKDAIPDSLRYQGGHNPLTLIHDALSVGLHSEDDAQCLEVAQDIRLLLTDLAERTQQALKNNDELGKAVSRLLSRSTQRSRS